MRFFSCLIDPNRSVHHGASSPMTGQARHRYDSFPRGHGLEHCWQNFDFVAVLTGWDDSWGDPLVATHAGSVAVGMVRLDNRDEVRRWITPDAGMALTDLALVLRGIEVKGPACVPALLGDFAFVVCTGSGSVIAAVDAFAVKTLYYTDHGRLLAFSSRAEALALSNNYDRQYLAERVAMCVPTPGLTAFAGVHALSAGHMLVVTAGSAPSVRRYWSPHAFETDASWEGREQEAAERCRDLLTDAVRLRLGTEGETWAELSGGMDSSSVVSTAQWLAQQGRVPHGLAGTISYVETRGTGADEREYSDAVAAAWGLRNEQIVDTPMWHDDENPPPLLDQPGDLALYPRTRRLCAIVRGAGGRILLTGTCGDNLFLGTMFFFADWIARGHIVRAVREMARRAAIGRVSFWELAYRNALLPLLPFYMQKRLAHDEGEMPAWIAPEAVRCYNLDQRVALPRAYAGRIGHKYCHSVAELVGCAALPGEHDLVEDCLDIRHPYLYRPLAEFALSLPPELCVQPQERKWILRSAMRSILPELVRARVGKGVLIASFACSLVTQRDILEPLIRDPILGDLDIVSERALANAFHAAQRAPDSRDRLASIVQLTLMTEAWLRMRSGRWPAEARRAVRHPHSPALV